MREILGALAVVLRVIELLLVELAPEDSRARAFAPDVTEHKHAVLKKILQGE